MNKFFQCSTCAGMGRETWFTARGDILPGRPPMAADEPVSHGTCPSCQIDWMTDLSRREFEAGDFTISSEKLNILRHAIGYDDAGNDRYNGAIGDQRRNHFVTHPAARDFNLCKELVAMGYMADHGPRKTIGGDYLFTVTDEGREVVLTNKPLPPKITAGRRRYREFLNADSGMKFGEWLKCKREKC